MVFYPLLDGKFSLWIASSYLLAMTLSDDRTRGDDKRPRLARHGDTLLVIARHEAIQSGILKESLDTAWDGSNPWIASSYLLANRRFDVVNDAKRRQERKAGYSYKNARVFWARKHGRARQGGSPLLFHLVY
jgi:hypothetical protein